MSGIALLSWALLGAVPCHVSLNVLEVQDASPQEVEAIQRQICAEAERARVAPGRIEVQLQILGGVTRLRVIALVSRSGRGARREEVTARRDQVSSGALEAFVHRLFLDVELEQEPPPVATAEAQRWPAIGWIALGLGAAALGTAISVEAMAQSKDAALRDQLRNDAEFAALEADARTLHTAFDVLAVTAAVGLVFGAVTLAF